MNAFKNVSVITSVKQQQLQTVQWESSQSFLLGAPLIPKGQTQQFMMAIR